MRKALVVAKQEIRVNVRRKGFILGVIGLPLLILASFFIPHVSHRKFNAARSPESWRCG